MTKHARRLIVTYRTLVEVADARNADTRLVQALEDATNELERVASSDSDIGFCEAFIAAQRAREALVLSLAWRQEEAVTRVA